MAPLERHGWARCSAHRRSHNSDMECTVPMCTTRLKNKMELKNHLLIVHKQFIAVKKKKAEARFLCNVCGKGFASQNNVNLHQQQHNKPDKEDKNLQCGTCGKRFLTKRNLKKHEFLHGEPTFHCKDCGKRFHRQYYLARHILSVHVDDKMKSFRCETCGKGFDSTSKLSDHINTHTGAKPYLCEWCDKSYQNYSNLRSHIKSVHPDIFLTRKSVYKENDSENITAVITE